MPIIMAGSQPAHQPPDASPKRLRDADLHMERMQLLARQACEIADLAENMLARYMRPTQEGNIPTAKPVDAPAPYFEQLQHELVTVAGAIDRIRIALTSAEL